MSDLKFLIFSIKTSLPGLFSKLNETQAKCPSKTGTLIH